MGRRLVLDSNARMELEFWSNNIEHYNGQLLWHSPSAMRIVYSDASNTGFGDYVVQHGPHVAHGQWSEWEAEQSSTRRDCSTEYPVGSSW